MKQPTSSVVSLMILCLMISCAGCAVQPIAVTPTKTITIKEDVLVPVPSTLTQQVPIPAIPDTLDTLGLGLLYKKTLTALKIANGRLQEIAGLGNSYDPIPND